MHVLLSELTIQNLTVKSAIRCKEEIQANIHLKSSTTEILRGYVFLGGLNGFFFSMMFYVCMSTSET